MSGVYSITNSVTGRVYIGQSRNVPKRWKQHKSQLLHKSHVNSEMLADFNKYGIDSFNFKLEKATNLLDRYESGIFYEFQDKGVLMYNAKELLDYRKISHENSMSLGNKIISNLTELNREILNTKPRWEFCASELSRKVNKELTVVKIALREFLSTYSSDVWQISFNSVYGECKLCLTSQEHLDASVQGMRLF